MKTKDFNFKNQKLNLKIASYSNNDRLYIGCYTNSGELFDDITINLTDICVPSEEYGFIQPLIKDCGLEKKLLKLGIIKRVLMNDIRYNLGHYDLVEFDMDKLAEYDPKGFLEFKNSNLVDYDNKSTVSI